MTLQGVADMYHFVVADLSSGGYVFHLFQGKGRRFLKLCQYDPVICWPSVPLTEDEREITIHIRLLLLCYSSVRCTKVTARVSSL